MTKTNKILGGVKVTISASFQDQVYNVWNDGMNHYKFYITISANGEKTRFTFFDSFSNWQKNITELSEDELLNAFDCFLSDASCYDGATDFEDFCAELGYTSMNQYREAKKAYNGCKKAYNAVIRLFGANWYNVSNDLRANI